MTDEANEGAGHTPGPWKTGSETDDLAIVADHYEIASVCGINNDNPHATARLIAAAPDLLEALKACVRDATKQDGLLENATIDNALSALAKAEPAR